MDIRSTTGKQWRLWITKSTRTPLLILAILIVACGSEPTAPDFPGEPALPEGWLWSNPLPQGNTLETVVFTDSATGVVMGAASTILRTSDGGLTWRESKSDLEVNFEDAVFFDSVHGISLSRNTEILESFDGGGTWDKKSTFCQGRLAAH